MIGRPTHLAALILFTTVGVLACSRTGGVAGGKSNDRESDAEYGLARDSWLRRADARDGLTHVLRSIEIDDDNSDAHHLAGLIFLDLCLKSIQDCRLAEAEAHAKRALELR